MDPGTASLRLDELTVVDVREPHEWEAGHIAGSVHIPLGDLPGRAAEVGRDRPVLTVCRTGARSARAADLLTGMGLEASSLEGGLRRWDREGLPLTAEGGAPGVVAESAPRLDGDLAGLRDALLEVAFGLQERFGDREPTDDEARAFMREWLVGKGRSPDEADRLLGE